MVFAYLSLTSFFPPPFLCRPVSGLEQPYAKDQREKEEGHAYSGRGHRNVYHLSLGWRKIRERYL
jgi:hypothetical protein